MWPRGDYRGGMSAGLRIFQTLNLSVRQACLKMSDTKTPTWPICSLCLPLQTHSSLKLWLGLHWGNCMLISVLCSVLSSSLSHCLCSYLWYCSFTPHSWFINQMFQEQWFFFIRWHKMSFNARKYCENKLVHINIMLQAKMHNIIWLSNLISSWYSKALYAGLSGHHQCPQTLVRCTWTLPQQINTKISLTWQSHHDANSAHVK